VSLPIGQDRYLELLKRCLTADLYDESAWSVLTGWRSGQGGLAQRMRRAAARFLERRGVLLVRKRGFDPALRAETGVWRGGSAIFMRAVLLQLGVTDRQVWVADSFAGLPKPTNVHDQVEKAWDMSENPYLAVSLEQVRANFARFGLLDEQVRFLKGWFRDTLPTAPIERLALLRLDGDMYEATMDALENLYAKVSGGGFVIVDDYGSWPACQLAVDRFRASHRIAADLIPVAGGAVYWRVPAASAH